jgi:hypothetical protein
MVDGSFASALIALADYLQKAISIKICVEEHQSVFCRSTHHLYHHNEVSKHHDEVT